MSKRKIGDSEDSRPPKELKKGLSLIDILNLSINFSKHYSFTYPPPDPYRPSSSDNSEDGSEEDDLLGGEYTDTESLTSSIMSADTVVETGRVTPNILPTVESDLCLKPADDAPVEGRNKETLLAGKTLLIRNAHGIFTIKILTRENLTNSKYRCYSNDARTRVRQTITFTTNLRLLKLLVGVTFTTFTDPTIPPVEPVDGGATETAPALDQTAPVLDPSKSSTTAVGTTVDYRPLECPQWDFRFLVGRGMPGQPHFALRAQLTIT